MSVEGYYQVYHLYLSWLRCSMGYVVNHYGKAPMLEIDLDLELNQIHVISFPCILVMQYKNMPMPKVDSGKHIACSVSI